MKDLFHSIKFWEIIFVIVTLLLVSPILIEFLIFAFIPLALLSLVPSLLAFKAKKFYLILLNVLILIGSAALYIYLW